MVRITSTGKYLRSQKALVDSDLELQQDIDVAVERFKNNPTDTRLNVHPLQKSKLGLLSLSVTDDIRIIFEYSTKTTVRFLTIGTHVQVYPGYQKK